MPFCPDCRTEYVAGIAACADCGTALVASLPEEAHAPVMEPERPHADWVAIARLTSQQYAEMVLEVLRAKDIPAVLLSSVGYFGATGQMGISSYPPVGGAFSLMVPPDCVAEAERHAEVILGDTWKSTRLRDDPEHRES